MRNLSLYSEKELLILASQGCQQSFAHLFDLNKDKLYSFIVGLIKSESTALDMVQDIFMKLWINKESLAEIDNFGGYLYRSAKNQVINAVKKSIQESLYLKQMLNEPIVTNKMEEDFDYKQLKERLNSIIKDLPKQQKMVYKLSRDHGMRHEDIAQELKISTNTVKNHMAEALKTIKKMFKFQ